MGSFESTIHSDGHGPSAGLDYEIVRLIGKGGYGEVWLVRDRQGEYRACKVVYRESFQHERPYEREYEGICKFEPVSRANDSQVKILYVGRRDAAGYFFYIMELADDANGAAGVQPDSYVPKTLRSEMERHGRLPARACVEIAIPLCEALENLHSHGLIHRDIKPGNIIFVQGVPKLADIGLVTDADVTVSYVGTGGFIPPEGPTSPQADIYGLGKTLYEIGTGKDRLDYPELPADFGEFPDRAELLELNCVIAKACEPDAKKRYATATALRSDLKLCREGKSVRQRRSSRRNLKLVAVIGLIAFLVAALSWPRNHPSIVPAPVISTAPISSPDPTRVAEAEAKLRETYRAQLAGGSVAARQQAAYDLASQSNLAQDPATQLASLRVASLLAAKSGNVTLAMQFCDLIGDRFHTNALPGKIEILTQNTGDPQFGVKVAGACIQAGFEAILNDDYVDGARLVELSRASAKSTSNTRVLYDAEFLAREMARCGKEYDVIQSSKEALQKNPNDAAAGFVVGKFLCFVKNDWESGLPLMARGAEGSMQHILSDEINHKPKTSQEKIALADQWRKLAEVDSTNQTDYAQRARYWYLKAVASVPEADQPALRRQLDDKINAAPTEPAEIHIYSREDGTETIDIYSDEIRWKAGRGAVNNRINQASLGDFKAKDLKVIKNTGLTRYMPGEVDFSTARLAVDHRPKRARTKLEILPDHVHLTLTHAVAGFGEMEVTVLFGTPK